MLKYKINANNRKSEEFDIQLEDFYCDPNLQYVSGTTKTYLGLTEGESIYIDNDFSYRNFRGVITKTETVRRYGYVSVFQKFPVQWVKYINYLDEENNGKFVRYIQVGDKLYYENLADKDNVEFVINGNSYYLDEETQTVSVKVKKAIDNNTVEVDGVEYTLLQEASDGNYTLVDEFCNVIDNDVYEPEYNIFPSFKRIQKVVINEPKENKIAIKKAYRAGYKPYVVLDGQKYTYEKFYGEDGKVVGYGPVVNDMPYNDPAYFDEEEGVQRNGYYEARHDASFGATITIGGEVLYVNQDFEAMDEGPYVLLETVRMLPDVMVGDIIHAETSLDEQRIVVHEEEDGDKYVVVGGKRFSVIKGLCDKVVVGGVELDLGTAYNLNDLSVGSIVRSEDTLFKVTDIEDGYIKTVVRGEFKNGVWVSKPSYVQTGEGVTERVDNYEYEVVNCDGFLIGDEAVAMQKEDYTVGGEVCVNEYITLETTDSIDYNVEAVDANRLLCMAYVDETVYKEDVLESIRGEINELVVDNVSHYAFTITNTAFGVRPLRPETGLAAVLACTGAVSSDCFTLIHSSQNGEASGRLKLNVLQDYFSVPVSLSTANGIGINKNDYVTTTLFDKEVEKSLNELVDVEKDIYYPVIYQGGNCRLVDTINIALHFRTRNLESWKITKDLGESDVNHGASNWFVTDYTPYKKNATAYIDESDLLGLMYFTDQDLELDREKLTKSFLRLSYYDSYNPSNQSLLATQTIFWDMSELHRRAAAENENTLYYPVQLVGDKKEPSGATRYNSVMSEPCTINSILEPATNFSKIRLESGYHVKDKYRTENSSEGYYNYILKHFSNIEEVQDIYMKAEFFHAGIGRKIPMIIPSDESGERCLDYRQSENLEKLKEGYGTSKIYKRMYLPMKCKYDTKLRKFVFYLTEGFANVCVRQGKDWQLTLFEMKMENEKD